MFNIKLTKNDYTMWNHQELIFSSEASVMAFIIYSTPEVRQKIDTEDVIRIFVNCISQQQWRHKQRSKTYDAIVMFNVVHQLKSLALSLSETNLCFKTLMCIIYSTLEV